MRENDIVLDRIDLIIDAARMTQIQQAIQRLVPAQAEATRPEGRTQQVENMVRAFGLLASAAGAEIREWPPASWLEAP